MVNFYTNILASQVTNASEVNIKGLYIILMKEYAPLKNFTHIDTTNVVRSAEITHKG